MLSKPAMKLRVSCLVLLVFIASLAWSHETTDSQKTPKGRLYLVSMGSGDPDNITVRALNTIKQSTVILGMKGIRRQFPDLLHGKEVHDSDLLVHKTFMRKTGEYDAAMKEVKRISGIIRKAVQEGKTVSVLDSGDPTIYGPNMWYMEVFEDLNPEIIPGISCFNAANAALRRGPTWAEKTRSVVITNGEDVEKLAAGQTTMVFFTMRIGVPEIVSKLKPHYPPDTPVAIVADAGYKEKERVIRGTLATIEEKTKGERLPLYLVYVGDFLTRRYGIDCKGNEVTPR